MNKIKLYTLLCFSFATSLLHAQTRPDSIAYVKSLKPYQYSFVDTSGKTHSLEEFKGKYTYIDLWASWCYPCRKEYPHLQKMISAIDTSKIQVVSISIDSTPWRWTGAMMGFNMAGGTQWLVKDTTFGRDFDIDRIPRMILLDKQGQVLNYSMTRPSNEATLKFLNELK